MKSCVMAYLCSLVLLLCLGLSALAAGEAPTDKPADIPTIYPLAVFPFQERGTGVKDYGGKISDLLNGFLSADPNLMLVDRAELDKMLAEQHLSASGVADPAQAAKIGQLTGAKMIVTGSVFTAGKSLYITSKIISTETTRVVAETVKGNDTDDIGTLSEQLAEKISARIAKDSAILVPKPETIKDQIADLKAKLGDAVRPVLTVNITERQVGLPTIDPAAQTEMSYIAKETGFKVLENSIGVKPQPIKIVGEGISEFACRIGDLVSTRARLEVKAINPETDEVIAIDRQTVIVVDMTEQIAGKSALQKAAAMIAERLLPKLVTAAAKTDAAPAPK